MILYKPHKNQAYGAEYTKKRLANNLGNVCKSVFFIYCIVYAVHFRVQAGVLNALI